MHIINFIEHFSLGMLSFLVKSNNHHLDTSYFTWVKKLKTTPIYALHTYANAHNTNNKKVWMLIYQNGVKNHISSLYLVQSRLQESLYWKSVAEWCLCSTLLAKVKVASVKFILVFVHFIIFPKCISCVYTCTKRLSMWIKWI